MTQHVSGEIRVKFIPSREQSGVQGVWFIFSDRELTHPDLVMTDSDMDLLVAAVAQERRQAEETGLKR